jgi:opacity protein-like surface antigen
VWLLGGFTFAYAGDILKGALQIGGEDLLRVPVTQWVRLSVDVEEYRPLVEYADHSSSTTRSLAILPSLQVIAPHRQFQPYLGVGLGLGLSGYTPQSAVVLLPLGIEESLVLHVGGGVTYRLGEKVALTGSARFAQFKTADQRSSVPHVFQDGLDFSAYTVELGLRWAY